MSKFGFLGLERASQNETSDFLPSVAGHSALEEAQRILLKPPHPENLISAYEEAAQGWFWATDSAGELTYLTPNALSILGAGTGEGAKALFANLFLQNNDELEAGRTLSFAMIRNTSFSKLVVTNAFGPQHRWWSISGTPQFDGDGNFTGYCGSGVDITSQREFSENATRIAMCDPLTELPNRLSMSQVLDAHLSKYHFHKQPCAILLIDLDRFKQVNDTLGHPSGDALLKFVAQRLFKLVGDRERIFRLGGDEFNIFVRNSEDRAALETLGNEIIACLSEPYSIDGKRCSIGASVGIAVSPHDGLTADDLIRNADLALYGSKANGRGRATFFSQELLETAKDRRGIEEDLRDALARHEFEVYYQPIVRCADNKATGVEALVRWCHPTRGPISPELFIPIAEEANLISALGEWVLRRACDDASKWPGKIRVAVNISPIQFASGLLPNLVVSALANSGLEANRLELEVTEGVFLSESDDTDQTFATLKRIGVRLALDDFGTGYSSLGYLRTAPFDKIKIDKSFVYAATLPGSRNSAIIAAIVALADALEMETTAEGIETEDQLSLIRDLKVSHVQGYIYSKPVQDAIVNDQLHSGNWAITPNGPSHQRSDRKSVYRKVRAIFGNHCRTILIRNLSESGALIEGLDNVPTGSKLLIDFAEGQLVFAKVVRNHSRLSGVQFESPLDRDEEGRFHPRHRVSKLQLRLLGISSKHELEVVPAISENNSEELEELRDRLGMASQTTGGPAQLGSPRGTGAEANLTLNSLARLYLDSIGDDPGRHETETTLLRDHVLPHFGQMRPGEISAQYLSKWFESTKRRDTLDQAAIEQMILLLQRFNVREIANVEGKALSRKAKHERHLSADEIERLDAAVAESHNQHLKFVVALLMLTGVRQRDLSEAQWNHFDLADKIWHIPDPNSGKSRSVPLSQKAADLIAQLPRLEGCPFLIANPKTGKPYISFAGSWQTAITRADLMGLEIDDVRNCIEPSKVGEP